MQAEAKSRITMSRNARRSGFTVAAAGLLGTVWRHGTFDSPFLTITLSDGRRIVFTAMQSISLVSIPIGLLIGIAGFVLHRRYMRNAIADPTTAGIFDPSVAWPDER